MPPVRPYHPEVTQADHVSTAREVYDATAEAYAQFVGTEISAATEGPIDRALISAFVELVTGHPASRVADVGCGPGRVAAFLAGQDIEVVGIDVSPAMLDVARKAHPGIPFEEGSLTALPIPDHSLGAAVCWYSIIYTPPQHLDGVVAELARVLAPHAHLLVAFQAGEGEGVRRADAYGTRISLTSYRHSPDDVVRRLTTAGFEVRAQAVREPEFAHESTRQAFVLARTAGR